MGLQTEKTIEIEAPPDRVWAVLIDVEKWHEWTASIASIQRLDSGVFKIGSKARIRQPGLPTLIWSVTSLAPDREFTWETRSLGARTVAAHEITPLANRCAVLLHVSQSGVFVSLLRPWIARLTRRNLELEAAGLKRRCESMDS